MLGSLRDADDAVHETWLRLDRGDISAISELRSTEQSFSGGPYASNDRTGTAPNGGSVRVGHDQP